MARIHPDFCLSDLPAGPTNAGTAGTEADEVFTFGSIAELLKPITSFAPMWDYGCGVIAGPSVCGASHAGNDWFNRDVNAINEPNRPIPSGGIPGRWGLAATVCGLAFGWVYSAPPMRLKRNGWLSTSVRAACNEGLLGLMPRLLADPVGRAAWFNATGTTLFVLGMLCAAIAVRSLI